KVEPKIEPLGAGVNSSLCQPPAHVAYFPNPAAANKITKIPHVLRVTPHVHYDKQNTHLLRELNNTLRLKKSRCEGLLSKNRTRPVVAEQKLNEHWIVSSSRSCDTYNLRTFLFQKLGDARETLRYIPPVGTIFPRFLVNVD